MRPPSLAAGVQAASANGRRTGRASIGVMIVDDHALVRAGLRRILEGMAGVRIVAEAGDGREALALLKTCRPDVVLMDVAMPGLNGLEASDRIRKKCPAIRVIMLSMHANEEYVLRALRGGAVGYVLKDASVDDLEEALRAAVRGETYIGHGLPAWLRKELQGTVSPQRTGAAPLTPRQREVLQLIAEGYGTKEIAFMLGIGVKTVETHRAQIMERLNIRDVPGLVRHAMRLGLIPPEA